MEGTDTNVLVNTMNGSKVHQTKVVTGLIVTDLNGNNQVNLPRTFSRDIIPASKNEIPTKELVVKWKHLSKIAEKLPAHIPEAKIGILIGSNCPKAIEPRDFIVSEDGGPFAMKTFAGWTVVGSQSHRYDHTANISCHRVLVEEIVPGKPFQHHFVLESKIKEIITPQALNRMLELEFNERSGETEYGQSIQDKAFLKKMVEECKFKSGHYELPLPFVEEGQVHLSNNRDMASQRLESLKKKLLRKPEFHADYVKFMNDLLSKNYARRVPEQTKAKEGKVWYLPHHGVYHPRKPNKLRVVFDCSAKYHGSSLNDKLMQGPDLTNSLVGVLLRFRQAPVAFTADIESMFYQVRVPENQRDFLRFLWWPEGDLSRRVEEYQMNVHIFGAISSPSCSNFGLNQAANDSEGDIGAETCDVLRKNFYVDDCLRSEETEDEAIDRIKGVRQACSRGGFHLTKFVCNRQRVLNTIDEADRAKQVRRLELRNNSISLERVLGVDWLVESDTFGFRIVLKDKPLTRRGILATVSSIYDPLGMASPFLFVGKKILQDLCKDKVDWDDDISDIYRSRWEKWRKELLLLEEIQMPRCVKSDKFGCVKSCQLHHFSDASSEGYGQVSYLRLENIRGEICVSFLMGKARVAPVKSITIPRLELTAATTSVRVRNMLVKELDYQPDEEIYWTDSSTVLQYINNETKRFPVFVANRVQFIRESTNPSQWRYVESKCNPADDASRGLSGTQFVQQRRWIDGPSFLKKSEADWPICPVSCSTPAATIEDADDCFANVIKENSPGDLLQRLSRFSDWHSLKKIVAWLLRAKPRPTESDDMERQVSKPRPISVEEMVKAEVAILRLIQKCQFSKEIAIIGGECKRENEISCASRKSRIKRSSQLSRLDPFLDQNGLLRVGGRLRKLEELEEEIKHPVIIPRRGHFTDLIIRHTHENTAHGGRGLTMNELRNRYWIINGNSAVRYYISKCVKCRRLRARVNEQKMADLPKERGASAPPFTFCGVDYFGPFSVKEGRKEVKRYGVVFTCMASRAVHIETAVSLETDSFINALRRFIARRGPVREIRSDRGTNLVGAEKELNLALKEMNHEEIQKSLLRHNTSWCITWKRNPPTASHMGGVWERQIKSIRSILSALIREHSKMLDDESLRTLLVEVECIINSRPLTFPSSDPNDLDPLTPNHILTMKAKVVMPPPGCFQRSDMYLRKRWRRIQYLANLFWSRWRKEYLQSLQKRSKWSDVERNLHVGDVVLIMDDKVPRNHWMMARVVVVYPDSKGLVRSARVKTSFSELDRPISKLVLLLANEDQG